MTAATTRCASAPAPPVAPTSPSQLMHEQPERRGLAVFLQSEAIAEILELAEPLFALEELHVLPIQRISSNDQTTSLEFVISTRPPPPVKWVTS